MKSLSSLHSRLIVTALAATFLLTLFVASASAQATRTWVSGVGDDANPCSRTAPCKTFAGAISKTAVGGEIDALDPGGFGAVTITKAITIDGAGTLASVLNAGTTGILINADIDDDVIIRNLSVNGGGVVAACPFNGLVGINALRARTVRIENVTINNQKTGIKVSPAATNPDIFFDVFLHNVNISNTCDFGIQSAPTAGHPVRMAISDTAISNANVALQVAAGAHAYLTGTQIFLNNLGLNPVDTGIIEDLGANTVAGNASDGSFTPKVTPPPAAPVVVLCQVPKLKGLTKAAATSALIGAKCALGRSTKSRTRSRKSNGKVLAQSVPAGIRVEEGTKVSITVGQFRR